MGTVPGGGGGGGSVDSVNGHTGVVVLGKDDIGLDDVDNTSDEDKPVSAAQQTAINDASTADRARANHTGTQLASTVSDFAAAADARVAVAAGTSVASLVGGVVPTSQIPAIALNDVFTVNSQAAMLALTAQRGDMAIRSDFTPARIFVLSTDSPSTLADWKEITAAGSVVSVNSQSGVVVLGKSDVGLGSVDNTADTSKPVSTAQQAALDAKAPIASPAFTGTPTGITKAHVGLGNVDNTSDANKPVSTDAQTALDAKAALAHTHVISDVTSLQSSLDAAAATAGITPSMYGGLAWTAAPDISTMGTVGITSGRAYLVRLRVSHSGTVSGIRCVVNTASSGLTSAVLQVYNTSGVLVATTADLSSALTTVPTLPAANDFPFVSSFAVTAGSEYWVVLSCLGTTGPVIRSSSSNLGLNVGLTTSSPYRATYKAISAIPSSVVKTDYTGLVNNLPFFLLT